MAVETLNPENAVWIWDLGRQKLTRLTFDPGAHLWPMWTASPTLTVVLHWTEELKARVPATK